MVHRQTGLQITPEANVWRGPEREHGNRLRGGRVPGTRCVQVDVQSDGRHRVVRHQRGRPAHPSRERHRVRPVDDRNARKTLGRVHVHLRWT